MLEKLKKFDWGYLAIGIALIGIGIAFITFAEALVALAVTVGITLSLYGILLGVVTLTNKDRSLKFALKIAVAIVCIIGGVVTLVMQNEAIGVITDICCLLLIVDGAFKLNAAISQRRVGAISWWVMLMLALTTIVPAFILTKLLSSMDDTTVLSIILGVLVIIDGAANLILPFTPSDKSDDTKGEMKRDSDASDDSGGDGGCRNDFVKPRSECDSPDKTSLER